MPAGIVAAGAVAGTFAATTAGAIVTTAVVGAIAGAAIGATVAVFTGGDPLKGALMGAAAGAIGGAISGFVKFGAGATAGAGSVPLSESFAETAAGQTSTAGAGAPILSGGGVQIPTGTTAGVQPSTPPAIPEPPVAPPQSTIDKFFGSKAGAGLAEGLGKGVMKVGESLLKPSEKELSEIKVEEQARIQAQNRPATWTEEPAFTLTPSWQRLWNEVVTGYTAPLKRGVLRPEVTV